MQHRINRNGLLALIGALLILALPGCGAQPAAAPGQTGAAAVTGGALTPEQMHERWIKAMIDNDKPALRAMVVSSAITVGFFDSFYQDTQHELAGLNEFYGAFQSAHSVKLVDRRSDVMGYSVWSFEKEQVCYTLEMSRESDGLQVSDWGSTNIENCKG